MAGMQVFVNKGEGGLLAAIRELKKVLNRDGSGKTLSRRNKYPKRSEHLRAKMRTAQAAKRNATARAKKVEQAKWAKPKRNAVPVATL
jgi:ribosomal protein S21